MTQENRNRTPTGTELNLNLEYNAEYLDNKILNYNHAYLERIKMFFILSSYGFDEKTKSPKPSKQKIMYA